MRSWLVAGAVVLVGAIAGIASASSSSSSSGAGGKHGPMPTIRKGSTGAAVSVWQGIVGVPATGTFDEATDVATGTWQTAHGLEADRIVGPKSWATAGYSGTSAAPKASGGGPAPAPGGGAMSASAGSSSGVSAGGGAGGHAWAATLPQEQAMAQPQILAAVTGADAIYEWVELVIETGGHRLELQVLARALRVGTPADSVAVTVDFDTATAIAEHLDAYLLTPKVMDAIFAAADLKILPYPSRPWQGDNTDNTGTFTKRMVQHSDEMDAKGVLSARLVANEGKAWVITIYEWTGGPQGEPRHNGANRGFYDASGKPIQNRGMKHNRKHVDYSQKMFAMRKQALLDGRPIDLRDVARDPALAFLVSDEGRLPDLVHPDLGGMAA